MLAEHNACCVLRNRLPSHIPCHALPEPAAAADRFLSHSTTGQPPPTKQNRELGVCTSSLRGESPGRPPEEAARRLPLKFSKKPLTTRLKQGLLLVNSRPVKQSNTKELRTLSCRTLFL